MVYDEPLSYYYTVLEHFKGSSYTMDKTWFNHITTLLEHFKGSSYTMDKTWFNHITTLY
jgi:hypothetical protein